VRKKDDNSDTSLARAYAAKKTKSLSPMLASNATPCFSLDARSGACYPINHHRLAREPVDLNREGGSSASMAVDRGQGL
jgi:hypothetical protein